MDVNQPISRLTQLDIRIGMRGKALNHPVTKGTRLQAHDMGLGGLESSQGARYVLFREVGTVPVPGVDA